MLSNLLSGISLFRRRTFLSMYSFLGVQNVGNIVGNYLLVSDVGG